MSLVSAERIKLFSTRSPWACGLLAIALPVAFTALLAAQAGGDLEIDIGATQLTAGLGRSVVLVLAALAVTSEYRFGTIRSTFQAVPNRSAALLAKALVVAGLTGVIGACVGFGCWAMFRLIKPNAGLALDSGQDWRTVAGQALVFALAALLALGVGILVRQTAGAVALLLVYSLLVESLVTLIPKVGQDIQHWLPFFAADRFIGVGRDNGAREVVDLPLTPWGYLLYFAVIALAVLTAGIFSATRRDA
ncbi:ABC transporter permease [Actinokineospora enzanensis]|uniref:ABC transporter permease n=1 Tax=Actinokineospora enzanensis TaxID=155975 RepID=UPI000382EC27|nr:ABC transporter permease [Actinokineospora enzanensis]